MNKTFTRQSGFTYILVMVALVVIAILAEVASVSSQYRVKRDKEAELLFRGQAYMRAIESYYLAKKDLQAYPRNLEDLVKDPRFVHKQHIRRLYDDPMTGEAWRLVRAADGGIAGVASGSDEQPLKQDSFPNNLAHLAGAGQYSEWLFEYKQPAPGVNRQTIPESQER